jgi:arylsulfatase A-like enzyme
MLRSAVVVLLGFAACVQAKQPNIVIIMSDDMGFSDLGCYGGEINTPNLDALAANGLRFTQFYNTARCCPTRAALLTGLYPHQAGIGHMMTDTGFDSYRGDLNNRCITIAQALKPAGYGAYMVGKWHVTRHIQADGPKHNWPLQRGFDRFYGMISGGGSFYDPFTLTRDNKLISPFADPDYQPKSYYLTDAFTDHAVRFISDHFKGNKDKPFFMYVAYTSAHWPMHALPEDIAKYKGKYDKGYEPIRKARFEKAAKLGLIDPKQPMSPGAEQWDKVTNKEREIACMEVYAAMIDRMDQGIGRIVAELKKTGEFDNTLILFLQDNGGCAEVIGRNTTKGRVDGPRADKPSLPPIKPDVLPSALTPAQTRDGYPVRQGPNVIPGPYDTFVAYGRGWANVSNTPFREYKHWVHEGGISTPLIAHWPAGIKAKNELRHDPAHLIDLMATCVDLSGAKYPKKMGDNAILPMEGISLRPALEGKELQRGKPIFWEHEGNRAVREGKWKLVAKHNQKWELYDISTDRVESRDMATPDRVKELSIKYDEWQKRVGVQSWDDVGKAKKKGN